MYFAFASINYVEENNQTPNPSVSTPITQVIPASPSNENRKTFFTTNFFLWVIILLLIGAGVVVFFLSGQLRINDQSKKEVISNKNGVKSEGNENNKFTEITPPKKNSTWSHYFDPTSSTSAMLGCYGNLEKTKLISVHQDDNPPSVIQTSSSGAARTILDPVNKILYLTVMPHVENGAQGYIQLHDSEDHSKKPLFEKKTTSNLTNIQLRYDKSQEQDLLNGKIYLDVHYANETMRGFYANGSAYAGSLQSLSRCATTVPIPIIKITNPSSDVIWKQGQTQTLRWEVHYPQDSKITPEKTTVSIQLTAEDGTSGGGAVTYAGSAHEGINEINWFINNRIPLLSPNKKYTLTFKLSDSTSYYSAPYVVYDIAIAKGITIEKNPNVTSTNDTNDGR